MELFYIQNTVDKHNSRINGYFSSLDTAKEALKHCCDWQRENGTGLIFQVDMDVLNAPAILVCKDGKDERAVWDKFQFLMEKAFSAMPSSFKEKSTPYDFFYFVEHDETSGTFVEALKNYLARNDIYTINSEFKIIFDDIQSEYKKLIEPFKNYTFDVNARVVDDDGFKGTITAYNPQANMYKVEHDLIDGKRIATDGWYPPERLKEAPEDRQIASVDSLISQATAISEQSRGLADDLRNRLKYEELLND